MSNYPPGVSVRDFVDPPDYDDADLDRTDEAEDVGWAVDKAVAAQAKALRLAERIIEQ